MIETLTTDSLIRVASALPDIFNSMGSDSYIEYSRATRIEPLVLVDMNLQGQQSVSDILVTMTNVFSAYFLQAVALSNTIGSVSVLKRLDKFNPTRSAKDAAVQRLAGLAIEQYALKLPAPMDSSSPYHHASLEAAYVGPTKVTTTSKEAVVSLRDIENLAVGKVLNVEFTDGKCTVSVPVQVRLAPLGIAPDNFVAAFSNGGYKNNYFERIWRFSTGELRAWGDMIMCDDLISQHKKNLFSDKSGVYKMITDRKRTNKIAGAISGNPSIATVSNIAIIDKKTALDWGRELGAPLDNFTQREKALSESTLMIIVVVDTEWETVTIYYKSIEKATELTLRDLKTINKNSGPDILDMLKQFTNSSKTGMGPIL